MEKLLELTEKIVALKDISRDSSSGLREYKLEQGSAFSSTIYQSEELAAAVGFFSNGTIFPYHIHGNSKEILVCYSGKLSVITNKRKVTLESGGCIELDPDEGHMLKVYEDSKLLIITIPPDFEALAKIERDGR